MASVTSSTAAMAAAMTTEARRRAAMEETFETQSRARLGQLLSESRKMHRRSLSFSYCQAAQGGGGLESLLLACEVAEQVMANLRSFEAAATPEQQPGPSEGGESGAESSAEWERVKESISRRGCGGGEKSEEERKSEEGDGEAKATPGQAQEGQEAKPGMRRHTRSLSDSGMVVVLQMANGNQRACDRRRAQWEKKKKAQAELSDEARIAQEEKRERERRERERKEQEALAAKNERLLRLFVKEESRSDSNAAAAVSMERQKSASDGAMAAVIERKRIEEAAADASGDKTPRERRHHHQQQQQRYSEGESSEVEDDGLKALRSGSDIESAEEVHLGVEEWERQQDEDDGDEEGEQLWEDNDSGKEQKRKIKLRLMKIKPKIMSGRRKSKREEREKEKEEKKKANNAKSGNHNNFLLHSSPV